MTVAPAKAKPDLKVLLASPRGFCAGVDRAIEIVEQALNLLGPPIYVRHELVHNRFVVDNLKRRGALFVDHLGQIPDGATTVFSAHGVSRKIKEDAKRRNLRIFDATCPLVTKVHLAVARYARTGHQVVLIGHKGHPEVEGTLGQFKTNRKVANRIYLIETPEDVASLDIGSHEKIAYVTQTTLSVDDTRIVVTALKTRFPQIIGPKKDDICYATQNRQNAVRKLSKNADLILVVGSPNSSNSNRLRELAEKQGVRAFLIDGPQDIDPNWLESVQTLGITAGASAPEVLVNNVLSHLTQLADTQVESLTEVHEDIVFVLPKNLRQLVST